MKKILIVSGLLAMSVGVFFLLRLYEWKDMKRQIHSYLEERYSREQFVWEYPFGDYLVYWTSLHIPHFCDGGTYEFLSFYPMGHPEFTARMQCTQYGPFYDTYANIRDGYKKSEALKKRLFKAGERYAVALPADETGDINYLHFVVYYEATDTLVMKQFVNRCIDLLREEQVQKRWLGFDVRFTNKADMDSIKAMDYSELCGHLSGLGDIYCRYSWYGASDDTPFPTVYVERE